MVASDPRDKIYSLLGLIRIGIEADYSKTVEALYLEVSQIMLPRVPMDEWFDGAIPFNSRIPRLPTWIVDWESSSRGYGWGIALGDSNYNAAATMNDALYRTEVNGSVLTLSGTIFDEVQLLAPCSGDTKLGATDGFQFDITGGQPNGVPLYSPVPPGFARGQASLRLCLIDNELRGRHRFVVSSANYLDMCARFIGLLASFDESREGIKKWPRTFSEDPETFAKLFFDQDTDGTIDRAVFRRSSESMEGEEPIELIFSQGSQLAFRFNQHFEHTRHFYTRKAYLGYGPKWIEEGDLVCVIQNFRVPVLLRKVDDYYHFISLCFVLAIMDGEAAEMVERGDLFMRRFEIH